MAHGAGQGMESDFMTEVQGLFKEQRILCRQFNFDYMEKAVNEGKRRPPDGLPRLKARFEKEIESSSELPLFIGGKSMGGRVATMILEQSPAQAAICFGYPFHPPGKPEKLRTEHLEKLVKPLLVLQGDRDPFGKPDEIAHYHLSKSVTVKFITSGEHSFKPLKSSGLVWQDNLELSVKLAAEFIQELIK